VLDEFAAVALLLGDPHRIHEVNPDVDRPELVLA
jgi:hypothetical protein